jgi:AbrB family looped-hinge helix DNA binding protein
MKLITVSPKGQITIPTEFRKKLSVKQYIFEMHGNTIILKPVKIQVLEDEKEQLTNLTQASVQSFKFWEDPSNDIYETLL